jgi:hypothetical protein
MLSNLGPWILWMHDNRHVVFFREMAGDENWRAWRVDLQTGEVRVLTPGPGVTCYIQQSSRHFPSELDRQWPQLAFRDLLHQLAL